jgi:hypothetical protein
MIWINSICINIVTTENVDLATRVYGPDVGAIKGKITRSQPTPVMSNFIKIPNELIEAQQSMIISINGITVSFLKFLTTISH